MSNVVNFDGIDNSYVNLGAGASLDIRDAVTVCIRMKHGVKYTEHYIIASDQYLIGYLGGAWYFYTFGVTPVEYMSWNTTFPTGRWSHIAGTFDRTAGANNKRTYADGNRTNQSTTNNVAMGAPVTNKFLCRYTSSAIYCTQGLISEVQIYNRQLTDAEILYNYEHPNNPIRRGIQLNLVQESIQGPTWLDLSGNANNGTYFGGALPMRANLVTQR